MGLFSLVLFISLPLFSDRRLFSDQVDEAGKTGLMIERLKRDAVRQNRDLYLYIMEGGGRYRVSDASPVPDGDDGPDWQDFPEGFTVDRVEFAGHTGTGGEDTVIYFSRQGYSDHALIHCIWQGRAMTLELAPFLFPVRALEGDVGFDACI